jgi:hypothetical protein
VLVAVEFTGAGALAVLEVFDVLDGVAAGGVLVADDTGAIRIRIGALELLVDVAVVTVVVVTWSATGSVLVAPKATVLDAMPGAGVIIVLDGIVILDEGATVVVVTETGPLLEITGALGAMLLMGRVTGGILDWFPCVSGAAPYVCTMIQSKEIGSVGARTAPT